MSKAIPALILLLLIAITGQAQTVFHLDSIPLQGILLNKGWTFHAGDNPDWAKADFDDSKWEAIDPSQDIYEVAPLKKAELGWFRLRLTINPSVRQEPLALLIGQLGASEMYLNGRLIYRFGVVSAEFEREQTHFLDNQPVQFQVDAQTEQVLAVRYSFHHQNVYFKLSRINPCLRLLIQQGNKAVETFTANKRIGTGRLWLLLGWYLILGVMFLLLYNFLKDSKAYLYIGIYMFCYVTYFTLQEWVSYMTDTSLRSSVFLFGFTLAVSGTVIYLQAAYLLFGRKRGWLGWVVIGYAVVAVPLLLWWYQWGGVVAMLIFLLVNTEGLLISVHGVHRRRPGAWIFVIQAILAYVIYGGAILLAAFDQPTYAQLMTAITNLIIPLCSSIFLIGEFGRTAHNLRQRVAEVEALSVEKEQILTTQNATLELQVSERTAELSHKNQELVIEAALERVRSQSMAMQHSDRLQEVITVVSEQLQALGFAFDYVNFVVVRKDRGWDCYNATPSNGNIVHFLMPYVEHRIFNDAEEALRQGFDFYTYTLSPDEKSEWATYLFTHTDLKGASNEYKQSYVELPGMATSVVVWPNIALAIANYQGVPYTAEENAVFKRFGAVFNQAYTRFLDLKKAEEQAREAKIEAALERVRSRSLAMHSSEELKEVITVISEQLQALGLQFDYVDFVVERKDRGWDCYNSIPSRGSIVSFIIPFLDHRVFNEYRTVRSQRLDFFTYTLTREEKNDWLTHIFSQTIVKNASDEFKQLLIDSPGVASSVVLWLDIALSIGNYLGVPFTDTENAIFKRFGAVFGQAYTRFLDLQKAEAQVREAKIEAALERVRSRSLAMHSSEELKEVITLVFAQLNQLDVAITDGAAIIALVSEDTKDTIHWTANLDRISEANRFQLPYFDHPMQNVYWDAREKGLDFVAHAFTLDEKNSFWNQAFLISDYKYVPEEAKQWGYASPGYASSYAIGRHSAILIDSFAGKMYSDLENDILKRFARVFEQAYVRFLDLQKAEDQAKEAQIEAALERVRSQSMAMQHSDHLQEVITVVCEQLQTLGFTFDYVNFVVERADRGWDCYSASGLTKEVVSFLIPYVDNRLFNDAWVARQQGLDFFDYTLTPGEKSEWFKYLFIHTILKDLPEEDKQVMLDIPGYAVSVVVWPDIAFSIATYSGVPYTDTENAIFKRIGAVFGQAYTRFKDLKKAEEQARQAIRTASLDRVRAQIASMRTAQDLERITPLIWTELTTLQVPFFRCGVFIVNEAQHRIQAFLSTPDGHSRTQLTLAVDESENNRQLISSWQQQRVYRERWSHEQLQHWVASMVEVGQLDSVQEYEVVEEVKEAFSLQFIPFRQGMLYVGSQEPLSESELDLAQSLADAFSVAYARYEDFRQLEEAKVRVDAALTELKATQTQLIQKEKLASLGELTAGIAHEIQNPLNFVNNFSELSVELISELMEERRKEHGKRDEELENELLSDLSQNQEKINHHGKRAASIVRGMLEHSRVSTGERQATDLNALVDEYLRLAYQGLRAKDSTFSSDYELIADENLPLISVVPQEIGRVLLNLINNAFYAVNQRAKSETADYQPKVTVSTKQKDNQVQISVQDNGRGIPAAIKDKIFQPFFTTKPTGEGTGLGLSLSYDIVTKGHGGTIEVKTKEGEGTTFTVMLPD